MDFLLNELSFHAQFHDVNEFFSAVERIMNIRRAIQRADFELFCHRDITNSQVTIDLGMSQAIQKLPSEKRLAWTSWLNRQGPYWIDERQHSNDVWLESKSGEIVTDTAIGEASFCKIRGLMKEVVSVDPSRWLFDPIKVIWRKDDQTQEEVDIPNYWTVESVSLKLKSLPPKIDSWRSLENLVRRTCEKLIISDDAFDSLNGHPFVLGAAERIQIRLNVLNELRGCFDADGSRTAHGDQLYANHFTGEKAWFTDSSTSEKREFESDLMFPHPTRPGENLICTWHGKVKTPPIRIHFSWPISASEPLYVVYVGPKITKR